MVEESSANNDGSNEILCSKLATKEHWIEHYKMELKNFEDFGDGGEVWFGCAAEKRMVNYIAEKKQLSKQCKLVDFGCGNGSLLRALRRKGYSHLYGVDYSEEAILLAKKLAEEECTEEGSCSRIDFQVVDLLDEDTNLEKLDVVLDKGTWDALSLSPDRESRLTKYKANICKALNQTGLFIICSCNYTKDELERQFSGSELRFLEEISSENAIEFGGHKGSTTTCAIFQRIQT